MPGNTYVSSGKDDRGVLIKKINFYFFLFLQVVLAKTLDVYLDGLPQMGLATRDLRTRVSPGSRPLTSATPSGLIQLSWGLAQNWYVIHSSFSKTQNRGLVYHQSWKGPSRASHARLKMFIGPLVL